MHDKANQLINESRLNYYFQSTVSPGYDCHKRWKIVCDEKNHNCHTFFDYFAEKV